MGKQIQVKITRKGTGTRRETDAPSDAPTTNTKIRDTWFSGK